MLCRNTKGKVGVLQETGERRERKSILEGGQNGSKDAEAGTHIVLHGTGHSLAAA